MKHHGIRAEFIRDAKKELWGFKISGHAGYAPAGEDIICAAVSALAQATVNGLKNVLGAPVIFDVDDEAPLVEARLLPEVSPDMFEKAQILFQTLLQAIESIQRDYPQYVRTFFKERR